MTAGAGCDKVWISLAPAGAICAVHAAGACRAACAIAIADVRVCERGACARAALSPDRPDPEMHIKRCMHIVRPTAARVHDHPITMSIIMTLDYISYRIRTEIV